jgi:hypothetical protein
LKTEIFQRELWSGTEGWKKRIKLTLCWIFDTETRVAIKSWNDLEAASENGNTVQEYYTFICRRNLSVFKWNAGRQNIMNRMDTRIFEIVSALNFVMNILRLWFVKLYRNTWILPYFQSIY